MNGGEGGTAGGGNGHSGGGGAGAGWTTQDTPMMSPNEEDFQQFIDMSGMNSLPGSLPFDFGPGFQAANGGDTPMTGTGILGPQATTSPHVPITSAISMPPQPAQIGPSAGGDPMMDIDAQIQMLQNQKLQYQQQQQRQQQNHLQRQQQQLREQQRQLQEQQQALFFAQQSRMVPPTPQSSEMQQHSMYDQFHRLRESQDVCNPRKSQVYKSRFVLIPDAAVFHPLSLARCDPPRDSVLD